jgi:hypothetical protein
MFPDRRRLRDDWIMHVILMKDMSSMPNVMCIGRRVRACKRLSEAAKTLSTRDHVRDIGGTSTLLNKYF